MDENKYKEELKANGVELDGLEEKTDTKEKEPESEDDGDNAEKPATDTEHQEEESDDEAGEKSEADTEEKKSHLQEPEKPKKRTIYQEYKEKKAEVRTEKERADIAEKERDELARKLAEATDAKRGDDADEAEEDAVKYAEKIGADPDLVKRIITDARKGLKPEFDEALKNDLKEFREWKSSNKKVIESQAFNDEFQQTLPTLKEYFPTATQAELDVIKQELDTISHTKDWHDKSLKYIAFEHKDKLSAHISPRKRGIEPREKKDIDESEKEFNPSPDFSKMSVKEMDAWNQTYRNAGKSEGLLRGADGKKMII